MEPKASARPMIDKCSTTELHPQPNNASENLNMHKTVTYYHLMKLGESGRNSNPIYSRVSGSLFAK
jgi:hypothetical protein